MRYADADPAQHASAAPGVGRCRTGEFVDLLAAHMHVVAAQAGAAEVAHGDGGVRLSAFVTVHSRPHFRLRRFRRRDLRHLFIRCTGGPGAAFCGGPAGEAEAHQEPSSQKAMYGVRARRTAARVRPTAPRSAAGRGQERDVRVAPGDGLGGAVRRGVVHHRDRWPFRQSRHHVEGAERLAAPVVRDDDDDGTTRVGHVAAPSRTRRCRRSRPSPPAILSERPETGRRRTCGEHPAVRRPPCTTPPGRSLRRKQ